MSEVVALSDYVRHERPILPDKINKRGVIINVWDSVCSDMACKRYNYVFLGTLPRRRVGTDRVLPQEHVLGFAEIMKDGGGLSPHDIRLARFRGLLELKRLHGSLGDYIRFMEGQGK